MMHDGAARPEPVRLRAAARRGHHRGMSAEVDSRTIAFLVAGEGIERVELTEPWEAVTEDGHTPLLVSTEAGEVELTDHGYPADAARNDALYEIACRTGHSVIATNAVHYATPDRFPLTTALAAVRARRGMADLDAWLPGSDHAFVRSGAEMARRFARFPGVVERTVEIADDLHFALRAATPRLPRQQVPPGHTDMTWLRHLATEGMHRVYRPVTGEVRARIERELDVIEAKDFPGYFLIVHEIVAFARSRGIPLDEAEHNKKIHRELEDMRSSIEYESTVKAGFIDCFKPERKQLYRTLLMMTLQMFQQLTGANYFFYVSAARI